MSDSWRWPGARWWKFDFHTHTPASVDYGKGPDQCRLRQITPREWLLGFMRAEVDCVAVTDHNTGEYINPLKEALLELEQHPEFRPLYLFPGVELSVNGGFHLLALLDTHKGTSDIDTLLGLVDYGGIKGDSDDVTSKSAIEVVEAVLNAGGIPIPAHTDGPKGLLRLTGDEESKKTALDANTIMQVLECPEILAMEVVNSDSEKPELYRQRKLAWAEVLGSDSHHPSGGVGGGYPGSHYTWVKMAKPSLEGLRLALLDGDGFSIRRSDDDEPFDPVALPNHFIEAIEIEDARYMGHSEPARLEFSPWLNALVGGRGTGKSTVIHALRLATRREWKSIDPVASTGARATFEGFNQVPADRTRRGGLSTKTRIRWTVMRDGVRHRVHWRQTGGDTVVEEYSSNDGWKPSAAQTVTPDRFPLRIFSQGQIAELAGENQQELLNVIDEAAGVEAQQDKLDEACGAFYATRARIRVIDSRLERRDDLTVELQDVERKLSRFEEEGYSATLTAYGLRTRQLRETNRQFGAAGMAADRIDALAADLLLEDLPDSLFDENTVEDRQALEAMTAIADAIRTSTWSLRDAAQRLREVTRTKRAALTQSIWQMAVSKAAVNYEDLVEALQKEGVADPNEYGRLIQERQRLDGEVARLESEREERDRLLKQSQEQLQDVLEARQAMSDARNEYLSTALAQNDYVRIEIRPYGNAARVIERSLREVLGVHDDRFQDDILVSEDNPPRGCVAQLLQSLPSAYNRRRTEFESRLDYLKRRFESTCSGQGKFGGYFNNYVHRQFERSPDFLDRLLTWFPEDGLSVEYSRSGDGRDFQPIAQASAGQRSAAMLALLLARGEEPLALDQPEDDLDNQLIYDLVVRQIRENKLRRQIIVVTHNPNIVVNGDAEMLHALEFRQGQCVVDQSGSLQEKAMREKICEVMEGGREAFDRRYRRLGPE